MKVQKILHTPIYCPYCGRSITIRSVDDKNASVDEEMKCPLCKRRFKLSELPNNLA